MLRIIGAKLAVTAVSLFTICPAWTQEQKPVERLSSILRQSASTSSDQPDAARGILPDLFTGTLATSIELPIPRGRHVQPEIGLQYRSVSGNSWTGLGWELELGGIERSTRNGVDYSADQYIFRSRTGSVDLQRVEGDEYRAKFESAFLKFRRLSTEGQADSWECLDRLGRRYVFGGNVSARIADPLDNKRVFRWALESVTDRNGNFMTIRYRRDSDQLYPEEIVYTGAPEMAPNHRIRFYLEDRADPDVSYATGFEVRTSLRLKAIAAYSYDNFLKAYSFTYKQTTKGNGRSVLVAVQEHGRNATVGTDGSLSGGMTLPAKQISYYEEAPTFSTTKASTVIDWGYAEGRAWTDFNGDARADYCRVVGNQNGVDARVTCRVSSEGGLSSEVQSGVIDWGYPDTRFWTDINADGRSDFCRVVGNQNGVDTRITCLVSQGTAFGPEVTSGAIDWGYPQGRSWSDVNADGRPDYCRVVGSQNAVDAKVSCLVGNGTTFGPEVTSGVIDWGHADTRFWVDINGDNRADFCRIVGNTNAVDIRISCITSRDGGLGGEVMSGVLDWGYPQGRSWTDVNGDGRPDYCRVVGSQNGVDAKVSCLLGTGRGFASEVVSSPLDWGYGDTRVWVDVNGDGRSDFCRIVGNTNGVDTIITCLTSRSGSFAGEVRSGVVDRGYPQGRAWSDVDGDSIPDYCRLVGNQGGVDSVAVCNSAGGSPGVLLHSIGTGFGGTTSVTYTPSSRYPNVQMPVALPVVSKVETSDGLGQTASVQISYSGGYFLLTPDREFRGFRRVVVTGASDEFGEQSVTETLFHQGNSTDPDVDDASAPVGIVKGRPFRVRVLDSKGRLFREVTTRYIADTLPPYFTPARAVETRICDGDACGRTTEVRYAYDAYGNIVREEHHGDLATTEDDRTIVRGFEPNVSAWIIGLPAVETTFAGINSTDKLAETHFYYDDAKTCADISTRQSPTIGNLTRVVPWTGNQTSAEIRMAYDRVGNAICKRDPNGNVALLEYDSSLTYQTKLVDPAKHVVTTRYYGVDGEPSTSGLPGQIRSITDTNGATTVTEYDHLGRKVRETLPNDSAWTSWSYVALGDAKDQHTRVESSIGLTSAEYFDGLGRPRLLVKRGPDQKQVGTVTTYNGRGQAASVSMPYYVSDGPTLSSKRQYDALGRVIRITHPNGSQRRMCFNDGVTVVIDENLHRRRYTRDAYSRLLTVEDYLGRYPGECTTDRVVPTSDADKQQFHKLFANSALGDTRSPYATTTYAYDRLGNLISLTDAKKNKTEFAYDRLNRRTEVRDPNSGRWRHEYDANGNVTRRLDARGRSVYMRYDTVNRLTQRDIGTAKPAGKGDVVFTYDGPSLYGKGRLSSVKFNGGSTAYLYDSQGREIEIRRRIGGQAYTSRASYDSAGRLQSITYPNGEGLSYTYNGPFLESVADSSVRYARFSGYSAIGAPSEVEYGNGVKTKYTYYSSTNAECAENTLRLCSIETVDPAGQVRFKSIYRYDRAGNVIEINEPLRTARYFTYDALDRLVGTAQGTLPSQTAWHEFMLSPDAGHSGTEYAQALAKALPSLKWDDVMAYDEVGNIVWRSRTGAYSYPTSGPASQGPHAVVAVGQSKFSYDLNGNMASGAGRSFTFDGENRLSGVLFNGQATTFGYDGLGQRIRKTSGIEVTAYIGNLYECDSTGCLKHIMAGDQRIAVVKGNRTIYTHSDHVMSTVVVTDSAGKTLQSVAYTPFGERLTTGVVPVNYQYIGQERDSTTGLYHFGARYYDPIIGRFISPDVLVGSRRASQTLNRYSYAVNNPLSLVDPDGELAWFVPIIVGAVIGGTQAAIRGENVLEGVAKGAIGGAFIAAAGPLGGGLLAYTAAGAAGGATNALLFGGDVGTAALYGAGFGALGYAVLGGTGVKVFGDATPAGGYADYLLTGAARGALSGGAYAAVSGRNVLEGAWSGAKEGALFAHINSYIGHVVGSVRSDRPPKWERGAWVYESDADGAVAIGNVISGSRTDLNRLASQGTDATGKTIKNPEGRTVMDHELGHVQQSTVLGIFYLPLHGVNLLIGGAWGAASGVGFDTGHHRYNFFERHWMEVPDYN